MTSPPSMSGGFSLVELMGSMVIGSIILLGAASMLGRSGDDCHRIGNDVESDREARALITRIASDLACAKFHKENILEKSPAVWPTDRLGFFCLFPSQVQSTSGCIGDLCTVNYYVKDLSIHGKSVRCLMRGFRESHDTFKALAEHRESELFVPRCHSDEPIAFGVVSFEARPMIRNDSGKWIDWSRNDHDGPEAIDVCLVLARRDLAEKLRQPENWDGAGISGRLLGSPAGRDRNANVEVYSTRMRFGHDENP